MGSIIKFTDQLLLGYTETPSPSVSPVPTPTGSPIGITPSASPDLNEIDPIKLEKLKTQIKALKPFSDCNDVQISFIANRTLKSPCGVGKFYAGTFDHGFAVEIDPKNGDLVEVYLKENFLANGCNKITYEAYQAVKSSDEIVYQTFTNRPDPSSPDRLTPEAAEKLFQAVKQEAHIQESLNHKNIVKIKLFFEFVNGKKERKIGIIAERMDTDLESKLKAQLPELQLPFNEKTQIALDIAGAVNYLHEQKFTHKDIKPDNILLKGKQAKLSDFGTTSTMGEASSTVTCPRINPPEIKTSSLWTSKSDVYQFGLLLWHLFNPVTTEQEFKADYQYPPIEKMFENWSKSSETIISLIVSCLNANPEKRPDMKEVIQTLKTLTL